MKILSWSLDSTLDNQNLSLLFERIDNLVKHVLDHEYDVLAFQDVNSMGYDRLFKGLGEKYKRKLFDQSRFRSDSEMVFVLKKYNISTFEYIPFTVGTQNRGFQCIVLDFSTSDSSVTFEKPIRNVDRIVILVAKLETGDSVFNIKKSQAACIDKYIASNRYENLVLCLDNSTPDYMPDPLKDSYWIDVWCEVGNQDNRYTVDYMQNLMVTAPIRNRCDRIMLKDSFCEYDYSIIVPEDRISRHCGVVVDLF